MSLTLDDLKRRAAERAVDAIRSGMVVGLGTGTTAAHATRSLGERLRDGRLHDVHGVPTSETTAAAARRHGVPLTSLEDVRSLDLTIDGADEVDPGLDLIKGGGGALLREKIVALASRQVVIVADHTKSVPRLGTTSGVPVEIVRFGWTLTRDYLASLGAEVALRTGPEGAPFTTDEGHWILDCTFGPIADPRRLAADLRSWTGVVEHGLFLGIASRVILASPAGLDEKGR
jgi:ribose 5-phosphate isomerase A